MNIIQGRNTCNGSCETRAGCDCAGNVAPFPRQEAASRKSERTKDQSWMALLIVIAWVFVPLTVVHIIAWASKP